LKEARPDTGRLLALLDPLADELHYAPDRHERACYPEGEGEYEDYERLEERASEVQADRTEEERHTYQKDPDRVRNADPF